MLKRRKDSGFTLIELMIVIAIIGILAVVLVPRIGAVRDQARNAGLETNMKTVQGYVESRSSYWSSNGTTAGNIVTQTAAALNNQVSNPHYANTTNAVDETPTDDSHSAVIVDTNAAPAAGTEELRGAIYVRVRGSGGITITSYDQNGNQYSTVTVTP